MKRLIKFKSNDDERKLKSCANSNLRIGKKEDSNEDADGVGTIFGYAATFDRIPDSYGDVIAPGAFTDTLKRWEELNEQGKYIPLLYGHNTQDPEYNIGRIVKAGEDERGLWVEGEIDLDNDKAAYVRKLAQEGRLYQFSFAYDILESADITLEDGGKAYELQKLELYEVSLVQIPANQRATLEEVKSAIKSGRRNSKADEDSLKRIGELAAEIKEEVDSLLAGSDPEEEDTAGDEASGDESGAKDQQAKAEFISGYKDAVLAALTD